MDKVGGNNPALAQTIAGDHPGAPGNHIYSPCAMVYTKNWLVTAVTNQFLVYTIAHGSGIISCVHVLREALLVDKNLVGHTICITSLSCTCIPYITVAC